MSGAAEPPSDGSNAAETLVHTRVRLAMHVVEWCANWVAKRSGGLVKPKELLGTGTIGLYQAARSFRSEHNHSFEDYARRRVRGAMLDTLAAEIFHERVKRSVLRATDNYWAFLRDDYDVMKHDEHEARRRFRAIANGMLAAAFMAAVEEAERSTTEDESAERQEYARAVEALRRALTKLSGADLQLLTLVYRELKDLDEASRELGIGYSTARSHHKRALEQLRRELEALSITRAPRPLDLPHVGSVLDARAALPGNDDEPHPR